jgi:hypothetical protein
VLHERFSYVVVISIFLSMVIGHHEGMEGPAGFFCIATWLIHIGLVFNLVAMRVMGRKDSDDSATSEECKGGGTEIGIISASTLIEN